MKPEKSNDGTALVIEDGKELYSTVKDIPQTFKEIQWNVFGMISSHTWGMIFSGNMFHSHSVESMERLQRRARDKLIFKGLNKKKPICQKSFLTNDENMKQLI